MSNKIIRTVPIIIIFLISMFSSFSYIQPTKALPSSDMTTLYFKDVLDVDSEADYDSNLGMTLLVSESFPSKINDSFYPPKIIYSNTEELSTWVSTWLFYYLDELSGEYDDFGEINGLLDGFELLFPNPLRIVESYEYDGNEEVIIKGDINFNLYLSSKIFSKFSSNDKVNVGIYSLNPNAPIPIPRKISNKTIDVNPEFIQNIKMQDIYIENVNFTLDSGETLLFEIELIPGNKSIINFLSGEHPLLKNFVNRSFEILYNIANNSENQGIKDILDFIDMVDEIAAETNLSIEDASILLNSLISTTLVYDSISHPSSVSLPFSKNSENNGENNVTYYLHSGNVMNYYLPDSSEHSINDLTSSIEWIGPSLNRSKILQEANAIIYINYKDINLLSDNIKINGKLIYDNIEIGSSDFLLDKTQFISPTEIIPINLIFNNIQDTEEITYNKAITLEISLENTSNLGRGIFKKAEIFYDSVEYPSKILLKFTETDNIQLNIISNPSNKKIIPGDSVKYSINILSKFEDEIEIVEILYSGNKEYWNIIKPNKFNSLAGDNTSLELIIISTENDLSMYGEDIEIDFSVQGKTGKSIFSAYAQISEDAVNYDIKVNIPPSKDIKHGTSDSYFFIIENNNSGLWPDSYSLTAVSENNWNLTIEPSKIDNLAAGESFEINLTVFVPKNTEVTNDTLTFTIQSDNSDASVSVDVISNIVGANLLENIFNYFESLSRDLGLEEIFDDYAPHVFVALIIIIIFIILIIIVFLITSRFIEIICTDRVKEIMPNQIGLFEVELINPTKKIRNYEINIVEKKDSSKWIISYDINKVLLNPKESRKISFNIKPTDLVRKNDWAEFDFIVKTVGKSKIEKIKTMIVIKNFHSNISINNIYHFPMNFKGGDKIITTFNLKNNGTASSENINILFFINGEEKNKVGDIIIPAEGFAEIKIPWIAVKGKNEISIVVKK